MLSSGFHFFGAQQGVVRDLRDREGHSFFRPLSGSPLRPLIRLCILNTHLVFHSRFSVHFFTSFASCCSSLSPSPSYFYSFFSISLSSFFLFLLLCLLFSSSFIYMTFCNPFISFSHIVTSRPNLIFFSIFFSSICVSSLSPSA